MPTMILVSYEKVASGGVTGSDLKLMGMYTKTNLSPGTNQDGRPIYENHMRNTFIIGRIPTLGYLGMITIRIVQV